MTDGLFGIGAPTPRCQQALWVDADDDILRAGAEGRAEPTFGGNSTAASDGKPAAPRPMRPTGGAATELPPVRTTSATATHGQRPTLDQDRQEQIKSAIGKVNGSKQVTDVSTPVGIGVALLFLLIAIVVGGAPLAFLNVPALLIVVGGVAAVTIASFSWQDLRALWPVIKRTVHYQHRTPHNATMHALELADYARHNGILKLQGLAHDSTYNEPMLYEGLQHVIDGMPYDKVEQAMRMGSGARAFRHGQAISLLRRAAEVAPAMGLIGTLVGLVQMLSNLQDPTGIGPGMAVALLTTLYGACLGHLALGPLAAKLERLSAAEDLLDEIYIQVVSSIGRKENPRRLELHLNSILPPPERVHFYD